MAQDSQLATLASEVEDAREALLEAAQTNPPKLWTADELLAATKKRWRDTVMMIALDELISHRQLEVDKRWLPQ
jgi:hypothetical protein